MGRGDAGACDRDNSLADMNADAITRGRANRVITIAFPVHIGGRKAPLVRHLGR